MRQIVSLKFGLQTDLTLKKKKKGFGIPTFNGLYHLNTVKRQLY